MVTPELKWPTTNLTPSPANLLATETPCLGSETSSPNSNRDLLAENAAGRVDVGDRLFDAVLQLRAEGGVRAGDRAGDAEFDLRAGGARQRNRKAQRKAERGDRSSSLFPFDWKPACSILSRMLRQGGLRRQRSGPAGSLSQRYCVTICAARAARKPSKAECHADRAVDQIIVQRQQACRRTGRNG